MIDYESVARSVLKIAANLDQRMMPATQEVQDARRQAWATLFHGHVWPHEAEQAAYEHYRTQRAFPLMPGDVIAYCESQPVWSSREHAQDWILRYGVQNPYSGAIESYSGISEPVIAIPESTPRCQEKAYLIEHLNRWVQPRLDELADAIVERRYVPWWNGGSE